MNFLWTLWTLWTRALEIGNRGVEGIEKPLDLWTAGHTKRFLLKFGKNNIPTPLLRTYSSMVREDMIFNPKGEASTH